MSKKALHKQIKSALEQQPERPFDETMWADLEGRINEDKEQNRLPIWLIIGLLPVLIFAFLSSENISDDTTKNNPYTNTSIKSYNKEKSTATILDENYEKIEISSIEDDSKKTNIKIIEASNGLKIKGVYKTKDDRSQFTDFELVKKRGQEENQQKDNEYLAFNNLQIEELMPLPSLPIVMLGKGEIIEENIPNIHLVSSSSIKKGKHKIQVGLFTGKTYSYLHFPVLTLIPEETKSSKIHFGLNTRLKLNENFKIGINLHYKSEKYSRFISGDNLLDTPTHFVSKIDSAPKLLGLALNLAYYPFKNKRISPYLGLGLQQDLKLQEEKVYYFSPSIYSIDLTEYSEIKRINREVLRTRTSLIKLGTEVRLSSRIQFFGESLRHFPMTKEDRSRYKWSWRTGLLFDLVRVK